MSHTAGGNTNPLLQRLGLPAYDRIEAGHVGPAIDVLLADADAALARAASPEGPADYAGLALLLDVPVERLLDRLAADQTDRPLLNDGDPAIKLGALAEVRRPLYEQVATHRVDASADPEAVVLAVEQVLAGPVASAS